MKPTVFGKVASKTFRSMDPIPLEAVKARTESYRANFLANQDLSFISEFPTNPVL